MTYLAAFALALVGFALIAVTMERHRRQILAKAEMRRVWPLQRPLGWLGLGLSLLVCVAAEGWSIGLILWCGVTSAASLAVMLALAFRPGAFRPFVGSAMGRNR